MQGRGELLGLLSLPRDRRHLYLKNSPRGYTLVEALIGRCFALRFRHVPEMLATGHLATEAADGLTPRQTGRSERELFDLRARAWSVQGNALRIAGNFAAAEEAFAAAERHLAAGTGRRRDLTALLMDFSASLRQGRHELAEAERLLSQTLPIWRELGDRHALGKVSIKQGILYGYAGDPERAVAALVEAAELVEGDEDLARSAIQSLLWYLIESGQIERARTLLADAHGLFAAGGELFQLKVRWLEAKLAASRGGPEAAWARRRYVTMHRAYVECGLPREATRVALDLGLLDARGESG
jgi:tetratricopeptide (TPR) repeat protein